MAEKQVEKAGRYYRDLSKNGIHIDAAFERRFADYMNGADIDPWELLERILPIVTLVIRSHYPHAIGTAEEDDLISLGVEFLSSNIVERRFQIPTKNFVNYVCVVVRGNLRARKAAIVCRIYDFWKGCTFPPVASLPSQWGVETAMFMESFPEALKEKVLERIRFSGREKVVCEYITNRVVYDREPIPRVLSNYYELSQEDSDFFSGYIVMLVRICRQELGEVYTNSFGNDFPLSSVERFQPYGEVYEDTYEAAEFSDI